MRDLLILVIHLVRTVLLLAKRGGLRAVVAESVLVKHQLLVLNRSRQRSPNLRIRDRFIAGFCSLWIEPSRFQRVAILFKPSTLLSFHRALVQIYEADDLHGQIFHSPNGYTTNNHAAISRRGARAIVQ